ncbi:SDR family oxidoreductase [Herbaspirillum rhizosphaerae]|uniref:SDR family oxidoreductase n=1 Tax=Herbaspirillum rhizosphaerae TaxID=346179 RepID=A0ABW8Z5C1_9BURK
MAATTVATAATVATDAKRIALVTGANKGIGKETVKQLAQLGYTVYLGSRDKQRGLDAQEELRATSTTTDVRWLSLDVTDEESIHNAAKTIEQEVGRLDVLVNNAGISIEKLAPSKATVSMMRKTFESNVFGPVALTQALLPLLRASRHRAIVNVSSELGSLTLQGYPDFRYGGTNMMAYMSSKTALNAFTVLLAKELKDEGFRINSINPGFTATDLNAFRGTGSVSDAAAVVVKYATLDRDGPTGGFFMLNGQVPW